eukprot:3940143-Rhodomonas_salina.1
MGDSSDGWFDHYPGTGSATHFIAACGGFVAVWQWYSGYLCAALGLDALAHFVHTNKNIRVVLRSTDDESES